MKQSELFLKLIRLPNLLFIVLAQYLFYYLFFSTQVMTVAPVSKESVLSPAMLWVLIGASVVIAAAGYIINDCVDVATDRINKPEKVYIENGIQRSSAMRWYFILNFMGLALSIIASAALSNYLIIFFNILVVGLLFFYSAIFKKTMLVGNMIVSLLTAWVILILPVSAFGITIGNSNSEKFIWRAALVYGIFAFVISMIREVVKDMEDIEGDNAAGGTTLPIVYGVRLSKVYAGVLMMILSAMAAFLIYRSVDLWGWMILLYGIAFLMLPIVLSIIQLYNAHKPDEFHKLSGLIKLIMLSGILSMVFF